VRATLFEGVRRCMARQQVRTNGVSSLEAVVQESLRKVVLAPFVRGVLVMCDEYK